MVSSVLARLGVARVGRVARRRIPGHPRVILAVDLMHGGRRDDTAADNPSALINDFNPADPRSPTATIGDGEPFPAEQVSALTLKDVGGDLRGQTAIHTACVPHKRDRCRTDVRDMRRATAVPRVARGEPR